LSRAGSALNRRLARSCARPTAVFASLVAANRHLGVSAKNRFLEFQSDVLAQVSAALTAASTAGATAKNIAKSKKVAENVAEIVENCGIETRTASARTTAYSGVTEAVIERTFFVIGQDCIGLARLFELLFGIGIVGIAVRMKLHGKLAVGALNLLLAGPTRQTENVVVVAFYVTCQNDLPPNIGSTKVRSTMIADFSRL
jgi:hypothetical protein